MNSNSENDITSGRDMMNDQCGCRTGAAGTPGIPGVPGMHGQQGIMGYKGDTGAPGAEGPIGMYMYNHMLVDTRAGIFIRFESIHVHFRLNQFASTESIQRIFIEPIHKYKIPAFP